MAYRDKKDAITHVREYNRISYDAIRVYVRAGEREKIRQYAQGRGMTLNAYIVGLIDADMGAETGAEKK